MNNFAKSMLRIQSSSSSSGSCDPEYDDITVILQKTWGSNWNYGSSRHWNTRRRKQKLARNKKEKNRGKKKEQIETLDPLTCTKQNRASDEKKTAT